MLLHHGSSISIIIVYLYRKRFLMYRSVYYVNNMNENNRIKQICAIDLCFEKYHWKWLEVALDDFRAPTQHLSLGTFTLHYSLENTKHRLGQQQTIWMNNMFVFIVWLVFCKGACVLSPCIQINWKYSKSINSWITRFSSKKNMLEVQQAFEDRSKFQCLPVASMQYEEVLIF